MNSNNIPMEFIEGSGGMYRPVRVLFDTPIYERAQQVVWHVGSYKCQIALVAEMLRLQQRKQLPSAVTAEDMSDLLVEESKSTLRVKLWEFELEDFDADVEPLLKLAFEVNTSMKIRDVEFEARRLLNSPESVPPQFKHPKIISQAHQYANRLTEQHQVAPSSKLLSPREVAMEVVPKVVQGFWLPPSNTSFNMPSQQLCKMAVGVTQAVADRVSTTLTTTLRQVTFSRSIRDDVVLSIQEKVRWGYTPGVLMKRLNCFATEVLNTITDFAVEEICALFQPQTVKHPAVSSPPTPPAEAPVASVLDGETLNEEPTREPGSATVSPPPPSLTPPAEAPVASVLDGETLNKEPTREPGSATVSPPPPSLTPPAEAPVLDGETLNEEPTRETDSATVSPPPPSLTPPAEAPVASVLDGETLNEEPTREPDSAVVSLPPPMTLLAAAPSILEDETLNEEPNKEPDSAEVSPPPSPIPPAETPVASVLDGETLNEEPTREPDSAVVSLPPPMTLLAAAPSILEDETLNEEPNKEPDSAEVSPPPSPIPPAETPVALVLDDETLNDKPTREPDSGVVSPPPSPPPGEGLSVLEDEKVNKEPTRKPVLAVVSPPPPPLTPPPAEPPVQVKMKKKGGVRRFLSWVRKTFCCCCCCCLPEEED